MAKYYKVEINKNLIKKLFKQDIEKYQIDLKKNIYDNFIGIHTNYLTLKDDLSGSSLTEDVIEQKVEKSKLLFFISNGKWVNKENPTERLDLLTIGDFLVTDNMEDGFDTFLKQAASGEKNFYTFYTKDDLSVIKKVLGMKSILEEVEIDDTVFQLNEVKSTLNWENMINLQKQVDGGENATWGHKEIETKRKLVISKLLNRQMTREELVYFEETKAKDEDVYLDMIYDVVLVNKEISEGNKELRLRDPMYFENIFKNTLSDSYAKIDPNNYLMFGLNQIHIVGIDALNLRAKFLNKIYKQFQEQSEENRVGMECSGIKYEAFLREIDAFRKISKLLNFFNNFAPIYVDKENTSSPKMKINKALNLFSENNKFLDEFGTQDITRSTEMVTVGDSVKEYAKFSFENIIDKEAPELLKFKENISNIPINQMNLLNYHELRSSSLSDSKKWVNYQGIYEYPVSMSEKILIAKDFLTSDISVKNINYQLILKVMKEVKNNNFMKECLIEAIMANYFKERNDISSGAIYKIKKIENFINSDFQDADILQFSQIQVPYSADTFESVKSDFDYFNSKNLERGFRMLENKDVHPNEEIILGNSLRKKIFFYKDDMRAVLYSGKKNDEAIVFDLIHQSIDEFKQISELLDNETELSSLKKNKRVLVQSVLDSLQKYNVGEEVSKKFLETLLNKPENDVDLAKDIMKKLVNVVGIDSHIMNNISASIEAPYFLSQTNDWGQSSSKKLHVKKNTIAERLTLVEKIFDAKYDIVINADVKVGALIRTIRSATTGLYYEEEDFKKFKEFFTNLKISNPEITDKVIALCAVDDPLTKKKCVDVFNKLDIMTEIENHILKSNNLSMIDKFISEEKVISFYQNNKENLKIVKNEAFGGSGTAGKSYVFRNLMNWGFIEDYEYDEALKIHLTHNKMYNEFPKVGLDIYNRALLKKHAAMMSEIFQGHQDLNITKGIELVGSLVNGFSKEIQREDATIEVVASLLRVLNEKFGGEIFKTHKNDLSNVYKLFGDQKFNVINTILEQGDDSLEGVISKIKFATLTKNEPAKKRLKI